MIKLARDLGLSYRGDCLARIRHFAIERVRQLLDGFPVSDLETFREVVANKLRIKVEWIRTDADIDRIAAQYVRFQPHLLARLRAEFLHGDTEGVTLERDDYDPVLFRYLAVIDARGAREVRAYFTAWHEITHLVIHPPQLAFPGFRRSPPPALVAKDPIESVVDHVAGRLAFWPDFFGPILREEISRHGRLTFRAIEAARNRAAAGASLFASALGSIQQVDVPTIFVVVDRALKKAEARSQLSGQMTLGLAIQEPEAKIRLVTAARNDAASNSGLEIFANMRVPRGSVLAEVFEHGGDIDSERAECQSCWETSAQGPLPKLPLNVVGARRGRFVYGLISHMRVA